MILKAEEAEISHHPRHAAGDQPAVAPALAASKKAWAGDKIDAFDEAALLMLHRHNHLSQTGDVVAAAGPGQPRRRPLRAADQRAVQISILVDLGAAHKPYIDITALQQQQNIRAAQHHISAPRAALLVG